MRKGLAPSDEALNDLNNRQTAAIILTLVISLPFRSLNSIKLYDRGLICLAHIPFPPKFRNLSNVPPYYIHNKREFAVKSCLRELFGERIKSEKDNGSIVRIKKRKGILRTGRLG
jgi:hypothetical protein